jgi:biotin-dependent carboxylase-like uncharacterized protein
LIEILTTGIPNSVQDLGRPGFLNLGISRSGAMDRIALEIANHLLGNQRDCAAIEVVLFPFKLRFLSDVVFAVSGGGCAASLDKDPLPPYWARVARAGQILHLAPSAQGARAYVAFAGGVDVPIVLSSRSTDMKGRFGGFEGRGLKRGDRLPVGPARMAEADISATGFGAAPRLLLENFTETQASNVTRVRTLPGAEQNEFTDEARDQFFTSEWVVTKDANRTGYRLQGSTLTLKRPLELFSHGIVPGTVQVPSSGQPIIQLADANTCGGYPKIATVIEADLWRLAQTRGGGRIRFAETSREAAIDALRDQAAQMQDLCKTARLVRGA